jgi:hypothetical protein
MLSSANFLRGNPLPISDSSLTASRIEFIIPPFFSGRPMFFTETLSQCSTRIIHKSAPVPRVNSQAMVRLSARAPRTPHLERTLAPHEDLDRSRTVSFAQRRSGPANADRWPQLQSWRSTAQLESRWKSPPQDIQEKFYRRATPRLAVASKAWVLNSRQLEQSWRTRD